VAEKENGRAPLEKIPGREKAKAGEAKARAAAVAMLAALKGGSEVKVSSADLKPANERERPSASGAEPSTRAAARIEINDAGGASGPVDLEQAGRAVSTKGAVKGASLASDLGGGEGGGKLTPGSGAGGDGFRLELGGTGASASGGLSREAIRKAVAQRRSAFRRCVEAAGLPSSEVLRSIVFRLEIAASGKATSVVVETSDAGSEQLEKCLSRALSATPFPAAANGRETAVSYPFLFKN
jgi:hypothetical protein